MASIPTPYMPNQSGLVVGYLFSADGRGREIESAEADAWLRQATIHAPQEFIWLHFNACNTGTEKWLKAHLNLSEAFFTALNEASRSTRIEYADETLVGVINDVIYDFLFVESSQVATLWLSADQRQLISVRNQPLRSIDRLRIAVKSGGSFLSPLDLVIHLLRDQADVLISIVRKTASNVDGIEDRLLAGRLDSKRQNLGSHRRDLVRLQRLLAPEPAALFRLLNHPPAWIRPSVAEELRQSTEEFSLVLRDLSVLQERIKLLQEEIASRINEKTSKTLFILTAVTVIALPINLVAGIFGMNVGGIPFAQDTQGFWAVVGLEVALSLIAGWLVFRINQI